MKCLKSGLLLLIIGWGESGKAILNETLLSTIYTVSVRWQRAIWSGCICSFLDGGLGLWLRNIFEILTQNLGEFCSTFLWQRIIHQLTNKLAEYSGRCMDWFPQWDCFVQLFSSWMAASLLVYRLLFNWPFPALLQFSMGARSKIVWTVAAGCFTILKHRVCKWKWIYLFIYLKSDFR